ncbi:uncharacterized protein KD926_010596 [Aspergillus affinis]|uniref:uncharacterized protein n=1 Tax=Aspergillus affinis TaxID=1070780 RepID=UPI0022FE29D3|nr:uncharacterized protein KD926_010596 [Aspergillus affinis]KAI9038652.1 hypothetical protein KD926_010596 [Aspergillus affinis]
MGSPKKSLNRPKKRVLVRWDEILLTTVENLNELLLLCVQAVCNAQSVKIPWSEVAKTMGHNVTEGAIVQHLAKLRSRRVSTGKVVPPPLRRGGVGVAIKPTKAATGAKRKAHRSPTGSDDESSMPFECDDASDEDYTERRRTKRKPKLGKKRESTPIKEETDSERNREEARASSEELLVPGATFLDFPNSDVSDDSSAESSPIPAGISKIVVLKYRRQVPENQELIDKNEEEVAPTSAESGGANLQVIGNNGSDPLGLDFNANVPLANPDLAGFVNPGSLLLQPFENMPESSYITQTGITYEMPLQDTSELPSDIMGQDYLIDDTDFSWEAFLADGGLGFS